MSISLSTALSGLSAANERMRASAQKMADVATEGARREPTQDPSASQDAQPARQRVPAPGTDLETQLIEQRSATYAYVANLRVLQTQVRAEGALLDIQA
ncbi:flagellar basal body rod protein [Pelomonas sp. CA6]|uniref:flagellar basal body rod protein n=1 Tax=Pelomonas sp. CA6 TaxID=2907999 RepID=UPI001F4BCFF2|nr:flagellar basal body rod protein [Pelomonas sp. CA6]MCH7345908.1 flagellar basal body rod protein [Pelomonas sp. CA6]